MMSRSGLKLREIPTNLLFQFISGVRLDAVNVHLVGFEVITAQWLWAAVSSGI
jgi:hypothetical protein